MRAPLSWLAEYVEDLPPPQELARRLTMTGLEVEAVHVPDPGLVEHLTVARIERLERHPGADRLTLCRVDDGAGLRSIVCGASNMKAGDAVVLARPGAVLPGGMTIRKSRIRGQESDGMLCSAAELGIEGDASGILILEPDARPGDSAARLLGLDDVVIEVAVTPNRGDCLSMRGLAREIAAACGLRLPPSFTQRAERPRAASDFEVRVEAPSDCTLYRGIEVDGVQIRQSPAWLRARLTAAGMRPINNVVDITNYVLLDRGQPLHAFDAELLAGRTIYVSRLEHEVAFETLDGQTRGLAAGDLVIRDGSGPVALAGVMGGARTAVGDRTTSLFLESASFRPGAVRTTSRRLGLLSESSYRFERGVDPAGVEEALLEAARLICELAGGRLAGGVASGGPGAPPPARVRIRPARVEHLLGTSIEAEAIERIVRAIGGEPSPEGDAIAARSPTHRHDLTREIDWIEEIARLHGYENVPEAAPLVAMSPVSTPSRRAFEDEVRIRLSALGLTETVGLAFCSSERNRLLPGLHEGGDAVRLLNPLRSDAAEMRRSLLTTLVDAHLVNARVGAQTTDLFAVGRTFSSADEGGGHVEKDVVAGLLWGPRRARGPGHAGPAAFWDVKAAVESAAAAAGARDALQWRPCADRHEYHPRVAAAVKLAGRTVGFAGRLHPDVADELGARDDVFAFEIDTRELLSYRPAPTAGPRAVPRYPAVRRDVSLLVPDTMLAGDVIAAVAHRGEPLIEDVAVFDEYTGEGVRPGQRALAFSFVYRAADRTLTDEEVSALHDGVVDALCADLGLTRRV